MGLVNGLFESVIIDVVPAHDLDEILHLLVDGLPKSLLLLAKGRTKLAVKEQSIPEDAQQLMTIQTTGFILLTAFTAPDLQLDVAREGP